LLTFLLHQLDFYFLFFGKFGEQQEFCENLTTKLSVIVLHFAAGELDLFAAVSAKKHSFTNCLYPYGSLRT